MSDVKAVVVGIGIFLFVHVLTWFQLNGQFFSEWFKIIYGIMLISRMNNWLNGKNMKQGK
jgi:hypothetical protein